MLQLIVGHRGVGKTSFLARAVAAYAAVGRRVRVCDLDAEIASATGLPVAAYFAQHGEARFREQEQRTLAALLQAEVARGGAEDLYIALGAGYEANPRAVVPAALLDRTRVLWLRRLTDEAGRIFPRQPGSPPRPRLMAQLSPLAEYQQRYAERQPRFAAWHDEVWMTPEGGDEHPWPAEAAFILAALASDPLAPQHSLGGTLTLLPQHFTRAAGFPDWLSRRLAWRDLRFELRDDLLQRDQLEQALAAVPSNRIVRSYRLRLPNADEVRALCQKNVICDIPLELSSSTTWQCDVPGAAQANLVASLHTRTAGDSLGVAIAALAMTARQMGAQRLKLAVEITSLRELAEGAAWARQSPTAHVFLPRTPTAVLAQGPERYRWFRTLQATDRSNPLRFLREGDGSSPDQPTLCEHWQRHATASTDQSADQSADQATDRATDQSTGRAADGATEFAAVLGDPVQHSRSPSQHRALFAHRRLPFLALPCSEAELADDGLRILCGLGLRYAAVTAPLKRIAGAAVGLPACNTLAWLPAEGWRGANTDPEGLQALLAALSPTAPVAIWGGGGTLPSLQQVLPHARAFALRTGHERAWPASPAPAAADDATPFAPHVVVWAAGPVTDSDHAWPPDHWRPQQIFDLDYRENSTGRAYALRVDAEYVSGLAMFRAQAAAQQRFFAGWREPDRSINLGMVAASPIGQDDTD